MAEITTLEPNPAANNSGHSGSLFAFDALFATSVRCSRFPRVEVNLKYSEALHNHPFYRQLVLDFYSSTQRRHPRFPLVRQKTLGVPLLELPSSFNKYFMAIEAAGRRNVKKAKRLGYHSALINYNDHLAQIGEIRRSTDTRQGPMTKEFLHADIKPCTDPPSTTLTHGWPYFGVLRDDTLFAYAGCFVCGEICILEHIYGHSDYQSDGIVPNANCGNRGTSDRGSIQRSIFLLQ